MAKAVDVMDILAARDSRAARQQELLALYARPLISFTMNIAAPGNGAPGYLLRSTLRGGLVVTTAQTVMYDAGGVR